MYIYKHSFSCFKVFISFIWLHWVLLQHMEFLWSLVAACRIFSCNMQTLSYSQWDLVLDQELNLGPLHWEPRILATAQPGKSDKVYFFFQPQLVTEGLLIVFIEEPGCRGSISACFPIMGQGWGSKASHTQASRNAQKYPHRAAHITLVKSKAYSHAWAWKVESVQSFLQGGTPKYSGTSFHKALTERETENPSEISWNSKRKGEIFPHPTRSLEVDPAQVCKSSCTRRSLGAHLFPSFYFISPIAPPNGCSNISHHVPLPVASGEE